MARRRFSSSSSGHARRRRIPASARDRDESFLSAGLPFWPDRQTHILALRVEGRIRPPGSRTLATVRRIHRSSQATSSGGHRISARARARCGRRRPGSASQRRAARVSLGRGRRGGAYAGVRERRTRLAVVDAERLVFDEYHQGYGDHPGTVRGIVTYLGRTASGHLVLQLAGAGLVLLLAVGPRLLPPRAAERIERRSPLEHVDALARAYRAVGATRTATARLVHGVRRRVEHSLGARSAVSLRRRLPRAGPEQRVPARCARRRARSSGARAASFRVAISRSSGQALRRLETSLTSFPKSS